MSFDPLDVNIHLNGEDHDEFKLQTSQNNNMNNVNNMNSNTGQILPNTSTYTNTFNSNNSSNSSGNNSKFLDKLENVIQIFVRGIGPLFVFFAVVLIGSIAYVHFNAILPDLRYQYYNRANRDDSTDNFNQNLLGFLGLVFHYTISIFLLFNIAFNYYYTIVTPPGSPPRDSDYSEQELHRYKSITSIRKSDTWDKFCVTCRLPKIERTHHCQLCKTCILRMDHHCPWVNNCVGLNNHRYFILFLIYLWVSCMYVCTLSIPHVFYSKNFIPFPMLMTFVLTLTISLALGGLLFWQMYLVLSGQTTIEFLHNRTQNRKLKSKGMSFKNPYDQGSKNNFYEFFRTNRWYLFAMPLLPNNSKSYMDKKYETISTSSLININKFDDDNV